ncbi:S66 peptidase family protein [Bacillus cereus group sp. BfR-BA-01522]|uniref:S66 family peptidase n=1 Tax=Bacillus cereus group sp. BfR-BA-01522 TaxID=2920370 RepID=UPI001F59D0CE|nr:S66 peptidase family protein [Bacillus cereus group sp. BfR-BA-01522]
MIKYPKLNFPITVGVTAPSSGVHHSLHSILENAIKAMNNRGYRVVVTPNIWKQNKVRSDSSIKRAEEFMNLINNDNISIVIPPWGGELAIEILEHIQYESLKTKWVMGYSDISLLLLAITLRTGTATAHGTNFIDMRGSKMDDTTKMWTKVLSTTMYNEVTQYSSEEFQSKWDFKNPTSYVFNFSEKTKWKSYGNNTEISGRLLGGCIDVIRHLIGTEYGNVSKFQKEFIESEPILWYFENCSLSPVELKRSLVQMKLAGWFKNCSGILFGRTVIDEDKNGYSIKNVYSEMYEYLDLPVIFDIDCGHLPPQITLVNGAWAIVKVAKDKGTLTQKFI